MITIEGLKNANEHIGKVDIKGKAYATVPARIIEFRGMCPNGSITTDIIAMDEDSVVMKTTITDEDGRILATGMAREEKASSYINKTSYIENCETSAVGRALGMIGVGSNESMASAEEMINAINNQSKPEPKKKTERKKAETGTSGDNAVKCYMCGNPIVDTVKKDGSPWLASEIVEYCKNQPMFKEPHCPECMRKKLNNLKERAERN